MSDGQTTLNAARRRFQWRGNGAIIIFGVIFVAANKAFPDPSPAVGALMALAAGAPLVYWAYEYQMFVRSLDELQSLLSLQAISISAGATLLVGAVWGVAEHFLRIPDVNPAFLLPLAAGFHALALKFVSRRYQ